AKAMAWDLGGNMSAEIERAILLKTLSPELLADLYPPYPQDHPVIVPEIGGMDVAGAASPAASESVAAPVSIYENLLVNLALMENVLGKAGPGIGSNSWAISGDLTATGMPLLANDPHLGIQMPSIWYQVNLQCTPKGEACPYTVAGFSFAGVPGVVIGHNDQIAWGFTNVGPDVMDLYIEKVNPDNPDQYEVNGEWVDMDVHTETILVGGGEPVEITIRSTRHGPVISETYGPLSQAAEEGEPSFTEQAGIDLPETYAVALRWTALEPAHTFEAIWQFNRAQGWEEFRQAAQYWTVPSQNLLYADVQGNIGYQMPGNVPIRAGGDGQLPVPGWTDEFEWTGFIPFAELPYTFNPPQGYIVTANNQVNPRDYPYLITLDWDYGFRAGRIVDMIENAPGAIDISYVRQMQFDSKNLNAETLAPLLLALDLDPNLAGIRDQALAGWDYQNLADSQAAALFEYFWWDLALGIFADDLPEGHTPKGGARWYEVIRNLVDDPDSPWWDDKATAGIVESRDEIISAAFSLAVARMTDEYGQDPARWPAWGDLHTASFVNQTLGASGVAPIEALFNRGPFPVSGGESIVNATGWELGLSYAVDWLPSMRMIVDLGDLRNSLTVHTTGQSGHAYHPHYIDLASLWAGGEYYPMLWNEQAVVSNAESSLALKPK
ncbi:MAG: penicillin acylase family protein, partial [Chloroflexi bacterium]|nr:penicillin acylase family protein [Chloroflexota bacterium]